MFNPRGFFKSTRDKEYEAYCQGVEDAMCVALENTHSSVVVVWTPIKLRDKFMNLIVEAADDFFS